MKDLYSARGTDGGAKTRLTDVWSDEFLCRLKVGWQIGTDGTTTEKARQRAMSVLVQSTTSFGAEDDHGVLVSLVA